MVRLKAKQKDIAYITSSYYAEQSNGQSIRYVSVGGSNVSLITNENEERVNANVSEKLRWC